MAAASLHKITSGTQDIDHKIMCNDNAVDFDWTFSINFSHLLNRTLIASETPRVHTLFSTKNSRTFQGLSFSIFKDPRGAKSSQHQKLKEESAPIFISDT